MQCIFSKITKIKARIEELDRFYELNYGDYRIAYFEKLKIKLKKLFSTNVEGNVKIHEEEQQNAKFPLPFTKAPQPTSLPFLPKSPAIP